MDAQHDSYEVLWLRAREAARGAQKGIVRLRAKVRRCGEEYRSLLLEMANVKSKYLRLAAENRSLENKVERLSLRLIELWGKEALKDDAD